ncbi:HD domain-containing protein [Bacillus infantis]|jgi:uncharacterized protein|uniref:HD domain-containing protein n=1 Tax=Bacillus infantis TaxID=324767 RepID=UPI003CEB3905
MEKIIAQAERYVRAELGRDASGHDWHHIDRVRKNALYIQRQEKRGDAFVIEMAALLHDIPDAKLNADEEKGWDRLRSFFAETGIETGLQKQLEEVIASVSFKGGSGIKAESPEAMIVQDADRLDAIGAIGIARAFAYGGMKGHPLYDPALSAREEMTQEEYRNGKSSTIHHFYEKLLKLSNLLNTDTAKEMAKQRDEFMQLYLNEFYREWNGQA